MEITALQDTVLKKRKNGIIVASEELSENQLHPVDAGEAFTIASFQELENEKSTSFDNGHAEVELAYGQGTWIIWEEHWKLPWHNESDNSPETKFILPEWNDVDWQDFGDAVSKYFTVGEVTNMSRERIPTEPAIKKNIVAIARHMDNIREWWGGPIAVNSWYRPWHVNRRIGSRAPNHPNGYGIDFRPLNGSVWELQKRFKAEWYDSGKWQGGFGLGARKGFVHLDLRAKRMWNY